jgi:predicted metal-binding membrane protein
MSVRATERSVSQAGGAMWAFVLGCAALAWAIAIAAVPSMGSGTGAVGLAPIPFLALWVAMMVAMMFPSVAPVAILWTRTMARTPRVARAARTTEFLAGYLLAWTAYGVFAFVALLAAGRLAEAAPRAATWVGAGIFAAVGVFQLTPLKQACLGRCRTPIGFVLRFAEYQGPARDLRAGVFHGLECVACCWALMAAIVALGAMDLPAMAALASVVLLEKAWRRGPWVARAAGVAFLALAFLTPSHPWLAPGLHAAAGMGAMAPM